MKLTFVFLTIAICAAMGIGFWLSFSAPLVTEQDLREVGAVPATPANQTNTTSGRAQLLALSDGEEPEECSFTFTANAVQGEGTVFTSDERLRVDVIDYAAADSTSVTSFIITPNNSYAWHTSGTTTVVEEFESEERLVSAGSPELSLATLLLRPDTDVQYTCVPWRLDVSVFTPPLTTDTERESDLATSTAPVEL